eukprot:SAG22_NODE_3932_length_1464_cov_1.461538_2_plen_189_part_00
MQPPALSRWVVLTGACLCRQGGAALLGAVLALVWSKRLSIVDARCPESVFWRVRCFRLPARKSVVEAKRDRSKRCVALSSRPGAASVNTAPIRSESLNGPCGWCWWLLAGGGRYADLPAFKLTKTYGDAPNSFKSHQSLSLLEQAQAEVRAAAAGCWPLAAGCWPLAAACQLPTANSWLRTATTSCSF